MRETLLQRYFHFVQGLLTKFDDVTIHHIRREHNARTDRLSCLTSVAKKGLHWSIVYVTLAKPSIGTDECMTTDIQTDWMTPIKQFLTNNTCKAHIEKTMKQQKT